MNDYFIFGSVDSRNYGVQIFDYDTDDSAERVYETYEIAGRNGDLLIDSKRWMNKQHIYWGIIPTNYATNLRNFASALNAQKGYQRLEDSLHPTEYYVANFRTPLDVVTAMQRDMGKFQIEFDRKPQRFLKSGETKVTLTATGSITNPTEFESYPLLRIYGTGVVGIAGKTINISAADEYTDVDCEIMEAYKGAVSKNTNVTYSSTALYSLHEGQNGITLGSGITKVEITPRWYKI